jgi:hypothetical protein
MDAAGIVSYNGGHFLLLNEKSYQNSYHSYMKTAALHEIGHSLGLDHPHNLQKDPGGISTEKATFNDTLMTYTTNNNAQRVGSFAIPVALMPADLAALIKLYPIQADFRRDSTLIAAPPTARHDADFGAILAQDTQWNSRTSSQVPFPEQGLIAHPGSDTANDHITLRQTPLAEGSPPVRPNDVGWDHEFRAIVRAHEQSTSILKPYGMGETFLPLKLEGLTLTPSAEQVNVTGNIRLNSPNNLPNQHENAAHDRIIVSGKNNRIFLSMAEMVNETTMFQLQPGAQASLHLRETHVLPSSAGFQLNDFLTADYRQQPGEPKLTVQVTEEKHPQHGIFRVEMRNAAAPDLPPIRVRLVLENAEAAMLQQFRMGLENSRYHASYNRRESLTQADGSMKEEIKFTWSAPATATLTPVAETTGHGLPPKASTQEPQRLR